MTPGIRALIVTAVVGWSCSSPHSLCAQDAASDLQAIRKLLEQQNDQIARLSAEVSRLSALVEGPRRNGGEAPGLVAPAPAAAIAPAPSGEVLRPAVVPPANVHVVVKGDSLDKIAKQHGITAQELQKLNKISDPKKLQIGQTLVLPPNATPVPTATPAPAVIANPSAPTEKKEPQ